MSKKLPHRLRPVNHILVHVSDRVEPHIRTGDLEALRDRIRIGQSVIATHEVIDGKACLLKEGLQARVVEKYPHLVRVRYYCNGPRYQCLTYAQILVERRLVK